MNTPASPLKKSNSADRVRQVRSLFATLAVEEVRDTPSFKVTYIGRSSAKIVKCDSTVSA
jgi:hypothetical protein